MIEQWADRYVGIPWRPMGRTSEGCDCWGLVRLVLGEVYLVDLPSYGHESPLDEERVACLFSEDWPLPGWREVFVPQAGDVVLLRMAGVSTHVGVCVGPAHFLHVRPDQSAVVEPFASPRWSARVVGVYRHG